MTSPAPREPTAPSESVLAALAQLDADPKLEGKGLSAAFARSFPDLPAEGFALAATEAARVAVCEMRNVRNAKCPKCEMRNTQVKSARRLRTSHMRAQINIQY